MPTQATVTQSNGIIQRSGRRSVAATKCTIECNEPIPNGTGAFVLAYNALMIVPKKWIVPKPWRVRLISTPTIL
jgi:hypothetical protein